MLHAPQHGGPHGVTTAGSVIGCIVRLPCASRGVPQTTTGLCFSKASMLTSLVLDGFGEPRGLEGLAQLQVGLHSLLAVAAASCRKPNSIGHCAQEAYCNHPQRLTHTAPTMTSCKAGQGKVRLGLSVTHHFSLCQLVGCMVIKSPLISLRA